MCLRFIIVDGNPLNRLQLNHILRKIDNLEWVGEFSNSVEAYNFLDYNTVDLIFLAAKLPVFSGFEFMEKLKDPTEVVLLTDNPKDALKAFQLNLMDCVAPPYSAERFEISVARLKQRKMIANLEKEEISYIEIKSNLKSEKIILKNIQWIEAMGDYIRVVTENKKYVVYSTMKSFLSRLPEDQFIRIHKSYIINLSKVVNYTNSKVDVAGNLLPLSRNQKKYFQKSYSEN